MKRNFSPDQIRAIRGDENPSRTVGQRYGVSYKTIIAIRSRRIYRDVSDHPELLPDSYTVADALDYLRSFPAGAVRGVVSSPPYNRNFAGRSGEGSNWTAAGSRLYQGYAAHADDMPWAEYVSWQRDILRECLRIVGSAGLVCWNFKPHTVNGQLNDLRDDVLADLPLRQEIIWCRGGDMNQGGKRPTFLPPSIEKVFLLAGEDWFIPKECRAEARNWGAWWRINANPDPEHPASFPLELAERMVRLCGGPVVDPFAGSGTVGLAAIKAGYPYYLCDNAAEYRAVFQARKAGTGKGRRGSD